MKGLYTKGKWEVYPDENGVVWHPETATAIATVINLPEQISNTILIAAAPDLLRELESVCNALSNSIEQLPEEYREAARSARDNGRRAIQKATY